MNNNTGTLEEGMVIADLLTPAQAAKILKVNVKTVTNLIQSGELEGVKVGRVWRIREEDLESFINQDKVNPGKETSQGHSSRKIDAHNPVGIPAGVVTFSRQEYACLDEIEQRAARVLAKRGECVIEEDGSPCMTDAIASREVWIAYEKETGMAGLTEWAGETGRIKEEGANATATQEPLVYTDEMIEHFRNPLARMTARRLIQEGKALLVDDDAIVGELSKKK